MLDCFLFKTVQDVISQVKIFRLCLSVDFSFGGMGTVVSTHARIQLIKDIPSSKGEGVIPYKKNRGAHCTPRGFIQKRSTVGAFEVPSRELNWKKLIRQEMMCCFRNGTSEG